jgi:hypothetical protein
MSQETMEYWDAINLWNGRLETQELQGHVSNAHTNNLQNGC